MKKILLSALALLFLIPFQSCRNEDDPEEPSGPTWWEFQPYSILIYLGDKTTGASLVDPENANNWLDRDINVEYGGETYSIINPDEPYDNSGVGYSTRYIMPMPLGLRLYGYRWYYDETSDQYGIDRYPFLVFGEFGPDADYRDEDIKINWGDGTSTEMKMNCYVDWTDENNPVVHNSVYIDGVEQEYGIIEVYK